MVAEIGLGVDQSPLVKLLNSQLKGVEPGILAKSQVQYEHHGSYIDPRSSSG